jgi:hypothetical protein
MENAWENQVNPLNKCPARLCLSLLTGKLDLLSSD